MSFPSSSNMVSEDAFNCLDTTHTRLSHKDSSDNKVDITSLQIKLFEDSQEALADVFQGRHEREECGIPTKGDIQLINNKVNFNREGHGVKKQGINSFEEIEELYKLDIEYARNKMQDNEKTGEDKEGKKSKKVSEDKKNKKVDEKMDVEDLPVVDRCQIKLCSDSIFKYF